MSNPLAGSSGKIHDSKSEAAASYYYERFGCIPCNEYLPHTFYDKEGISHRVIPDFYNVESDLFIEHKAAPLNSISSKRVSNNRLAEKKDYRAGNLLTIDHLNFGWNHSKASKKIIQQELTPKRYIVVFEKPPTATEASAYLKAGLVFIPMSALPSYIAFVRFSKLGLPVSFKLTYSDDIEEETTALVLH